MNFKTVTSDNVSQLYELNRMLAISEGQESLFSTDLDSYSKGFLGDSPSVHGQLAFKDNTPVGFVIFSYKFATYIGSNVIYIEDIYLTEKHDNEENRKALFKNISDRAGAEGCKRLEIRVMNDFKWGFEILKEFGFNKIDKWSVYRKSS